MTVFQEILSRSLSITVIAACILLLRFFLRKAPKKYAYFLWMILLVRLLLPAIPELSFGLVPESLHIPRTEAAHAPENVEGSLSIWTEPEKELRAAAPAKEEGQETMDGRKSSWMELLSGVWLSGVVLLLAVILISYGALWRTLKDGEQIRGNVWKGARVESPFVFGIFVPRVWIPVWMEGEEMECVISHEQVHIRRMDYLVKPLFLLAAVFYWFHPAVWLSFVLMNRDMEMSCDEKVMELYGEERREAYSLALLHISMRNSRLLPALAFGESNTKSRIKNILSYRKPRLGFSIGAVLLLAAAAALLIPGKGQEPQWDNSSLSAFSFARTAWILEGAGELEEQPFGGGEKSRRLTAYYEEDAQFEEEKNRLLEEIFQVYADCLVYGERGNTPSDYRNRYNVNLYFADEAGALLSIRLLREKETKRPGIEITCEQNGTEVLTGTVIARDPGVTVRFPDGQEWDVYFVDNKRNIQLYEEPDLYPVGAEVRVLYRTGRTMPDWLEVIDMTVPET